MSELPPKLVRIVISSPSDVAAERKATAELIELELAKREAFRKPLKLDVFRYDDPHSDTPFQVNRSAQASFDQRLRSADAEIAVAILCGKQSDHHVVVGQPIVDALTVTPALDKPGTSEEL